MNEENRFIVIERYLSKRAFTILHSARDTEGKVYATILGGGRQTGCIRECKNNKYLWLCKCHLRSDLKLLNEWSNS